MASSKFDRYMCSSTLATSITQSCLVALAIAVAYFRRSLEEVIDATKFAVFQ